MTGTLKMLPAMMMLCLFAACSGGGKKVLVMASGKISANDNTVTLDPGTTHNELTLEPSADHITVITGKDSKDYPLKDPGLYILNIKTDTLVGSYLETGTAPAPRVIAAEEVEHRIDSMKQLMAGTNVNAQSRNYNIPPSSIAFITKNTGAEVIGPYLQVPGSFDPSKTHEIYKFYTNKEVKEILDKIEKMHSPN